MPALITHDFFGKDLYKELRPQTPTQAAEDEHDQATLGESTISGNGAENPLANAIGETRDEREAFLLGNQGPDPLFFVVLSPWLLRFSHVGSHMHDQKPSELISAFRRAADMLPPSEQPVACAYLAGFIAHYALDSVMHPFVFAQQYALCDAGEPGLSRRDGSEVHAVIEGEFDEMMLYARTGCTVAAYAPERMTLRASRKTLATVSKMYCYAVLVTYGVSVPPSLFAEGVRAYRRATALLHSQSGRKRRLIGGLERVLRPHSLYQALSWRAVALEGSAFENRDHRLWENPFTGVSQRASFADLFEEAKGKARSGILLALDPAFDVECARAFTRGLNFSGKPAE